MILSPLVESNEPMDVPETFAIVLALIIDLERPRQEIFSVSQQTMVDLKDKLNRTP